jgi:hypothetical protein
MIFMGRFVLQKGAGQASHYTGVEQFLRINSCLAGEFFQSKHRYIRQSDTSVVMFFLQRVPSGFYAKYHRSRKNDGLLKTQDKLMSLEEPEMVRRHVIQGYFLGDNILRWCTVP